MKVNRKGSKMAIGSNSYNRSGEFIEPFDRIDEDGQGRVTDIV
jgi:hypothetical protein